MSYMHIELLYKAQDILLFKECYAMEKIHGSSANVSFKMVQHGSDDSMGRPFVGQLHFISGGESDVRFKALFDENNLMSKLSKMGFGEIKIFGEVYGGSCQGMSYLYGKDLKFIVFDVQIENRWLEVPQAESLAKELGLEFVHYVKIPTDLASLETQRDADSVQAVRNGVDLTKLPEGCTALREGIVMRPLLELMHNENRIISKFKSDKFNKERKTPQKIISSDQLKVLSDANEVADEWVQPMRLDHVLQKLPKGGMELVPKLIPAMVEDVLREGKGEIIDSKEVRKAIGKKAVELFKLRLESSLKENAK